MCVRERNRGREREWSELHIIRLDLWQKNEEWQVHRFPCKWNPLNINLRPHFGQATHQLLLIHYFFFLSSQLNSCNATEIFSWSYSKTTKRIEYKFACFLTWKPISHSLLYRSWEQKKKPSPKTPNEWSLMTKTKIDLFSVRCCSFSFLILFGHIFSVACVKRPTFQKKKKKLE